MKYVINTQKRLRRAVLFPNPFKETMASARIARWIAEVLDVELWDAPEKIKYEEIDELYFVYGLVAFSKFREEMGALHPYVKKYIFIENDFLGCHLTQLRKPLRERGITPIMLTTCPHRLKRSRGYYINWNQMTWDPIPENKITPMADRIPGMVYYGAFREGRINYFKKYMNQDLYPVNVYSGPTGQRKFREIAPQVTTHNQALDLNETLNKYEFTVYMEDEFSHSHFSSVANRFYECLAAGIPMLFDHNAVNSMKRGGFTDKLTWCSVDSPEDVKHARCHLDTIRLKQYELWRGVNYRQILLTQFTNLLPLIAQCDPCSNTVVACH